MSMSILSRKALSAALLVGVLLAGGACGSSDDDSSAPSSTSALASGVDDAASSSDGGEDGSSEGSDATSDSVTSTTSAQEMAPPLFDGSYTVTNGEGETSTQVLSSTCDAESGGVWVCTLTAETGLDTQLTWDGSRFSLSSEGGTDGCRTTYDIWFEPNQTIDVDGRTLVEAYTSSGQFTSDPPGCSDGEVGTTTGTRVG